MSELAIGSLEQKYMYNWVNKDQFVLKQGMLFRLKKDSEDVLLVVPHGTMIYLRRRIRVWLAQRRS